MSLFLCFDLILEWRSQHLSSFYSRSQCGNWTTRPSQTRSHFVDTEIRGVKASGHLSLRFWCPFSWWTKKYCIILLYVLSHVSVLLFFLELSLAFSTVLSFEGVVGRFGKCSYLSSSWQSDGEADATLDLRSQGFYLKLGYRLKGTCNSKIMFHPKFKG